MSKIKNKTQKIGLAALAIAVLGLGSAFAAYSTDLLINGTGSVDAAYWDIYWDNLECTDTEYVPGTAASATEHATGGTAGIISANTNITTTATLDDTINIAFHFINPDDTITCTFDAVNSGDVPAVIDTEAWEASTAALNAANVSTTLTGLTETSTLDGKQTTPVTLEFKYTGEFLDDEQALVTQDLEFSYKMPFVMDR